MERKHPQKHWMASINMDFYYKDNDGIDFYEVARRIIVVLVSCIVFFWCWGEFMGCLSITSAKNPWRRNGAHERSTNESVGQDNEDHEEEFEVEVELT